MAMEFQIFFKCDVCVNIFVTLIRDDLRTVISLLSVYLQQFQLSGQFKVLMKA